MEKATNFLAGGLLGAIFGVTLAILLAPTSGDQLRSNFKNRIERIRREVKLASRERRAEMERELAEFRVPHKPAGD